MSVGYLDDFGTHPRLMTEWYFIRWEFLRTIKGEIDFLVLAPGMGLFALEVKGGRVRHKSSMWHFTDKYGKTYSKVRGPFVQAKDVAFSLITALKNGMTQITIIFQMCFSVLESCSRI